jgi:hypothetical protein
MTARHAQVQYMKACRRISRLLQCVAAEVGLYGVIWQGSWAVPEGWVLLEGPDCIRGKEQGDARHPHRQIINIAVEGAVRPQYPLFQHLQVPLSLCKFRAHVDITANTLKNYLACRDSSH